MNSPGSRRDAKSPRHGSLPYHPAIASPTFTRRSRLYSQRGRAVKLLKVREPHRVLHARRGNLELCLAAIDVPGREHLVGLIRELQLCAVEHAKERPGTLEDLPRGAAARARG